MMLSRLKASVIPYPLRIGGLPLASIFAMPVNSGGHADLGNAGHPGIVGQEQG